MFDGSGTGFGSAIAVGDHFENRLLGIPAGAALAAELELIDRSTLNSNDRVALLQARQRLLSHVQAELYSDMAVVGDAVAEAIGELDIEFQADEVRAALVLTRRAAETQMDLARSLVDCYPQILSALRSGLLDVPRVRVIVDSLVGLETEAATRVVENVLPIWRS